MSIETFVEESQDLPANTVDLSPREEYRINNQGISERYHEGYWTEDLSK